MTTRLNALADRISGQAFGLTNYNSLEADVNYLVVAGADLASAATLAITNEFHGVTGTTTITNITDALGASKSQQVQLLIKGGPLTIQNNGGGTGNIRTNSGADTVYPTNAIVTFVNDGTVWREGVGANPGRELDYAQFTGTVSVTGTTEGTAVAVVTGNSITYDGSRVKVEFFAPEVTDSSVTTGYAVVLRDSTVLGHVRTAANTTGLKAVYGVVFDTPASGAHIYKVQAYGSGTYSISGGAGGPGVLVPGFIRVTRA